MRIFRIIIILFLGASALYGQGKIRDVYTPHEVVSGDTFAVAIVANAPKAGIERLLLVNVPSQVKFIRAFLSNTALEEPEALGSYSSGTLFQSLRGKRTVAVTHSAHSAVTGAFVYYFIFVAPEIHAELIIRSAMAERGVEVATAEPTPASKSKKGKRTPTKQKQTADPWQWQIVSPQTSQFDFGDTDFSEFERRVRCVTGWDNNSRALALGKAHLTITPEHLTSFFSGPFTIEWWQQGVTPASNILTIANSSDDKVLEVGINIYGQLYVAKDTETSLIGGGIVTDGGWHHIVWSRDETGLERLFIDAVLEDTITDRSFHNNIQTLYFGSSGRGKYLTIDELHFLRRARIDASELTRYIAIAMRDTASAAYAIFHFEGVGGITRSSIPLIIQNESGKPQLIPVALRLEDRAQLEQVSSPVILEPAVLSLEQTNPSKVAFKWKTTSEYGAERYELQRRIETFGEFEKVLSVPVIKNSLEEEGLIHRRTYSAAESLPTLKRKIDLYYRLAIIGNNDSILGVTSPLKFELGKQGDVFLEQNKPNPFNPKTTIGFTLRRSGVIRLSVFDIIGREVLVVANRKFQAGRHSIEIDATNWPGGIYFYKLKSGNTILTRRMTLAK